MLSRRTFLAASLGLLMQPLDVLAKKKAELKTLGPHTLSKQEWPPSIAPDFIAAVDKTYTLLADQTGRLAIVDLHREEGPQVIGELTGIGRKVIDLTVSQHRAYALASQETAGELQFVIVTISIMPSSEPTVLSRVPVPYLTEPAAIAAFADIVAVGGVGAGGENQVLLFNLSPKKRPDEDNGPIATINVQQPVSRMDFQDRLLVVLEGANDASMIETFQMFNPRDPQRLKPLKLDGRYEVMARSHDLLLVAGAGTDGKRDAKMVALRPAPHLVARAILPLTDVMDIAVQKGQFLLLGEQANRLAVVPIAAGKNGALAAGQVMVLPAGAHGGGAKSRLAAREKEAYIASDSGSVQVLNVRKDGWQYLYSHIIPRLPVASVAISGNRAVLAGADIKVYDISQPQRPLLLAGAEPGSAIRAVAIAGEYIVCLSRDGLSLRKIERPNDSVANLKLTGQALAYDQAQRKVYVLSVGNKSTTVTPVRVSAILAAEPAQTLPAVYKNASASNGKLLVSALNDLALYDMSNGNQLGVRQFPNLAVRDIELAGSTGYLTAVDAASHGFLLTINAERPVLPTIGSVDLPQDAIALAISGRTAVVVGRGSEGKDNASIVDISNSAVPKVAATFPVLEAASAVAIKDKIALVGGRGMELLTL
jgi:hypothetical protein